ncbi:MAG: DUF4350 domain-containing protein, partial [Thermoproteota archaeon]
YIVTGLILALFVWLSVVALVPSVDPYSLDNPLWNGLSTASKELKLSYTTVNDLSSLSNNSVVFVIGPSRQPSDYEIEALKNYVYSGGYLILMDEYGYINNLTKSLGLNVSITGELLRDPLYYWRSSAFPIVNAFVGNTSFKVYLNYASTINHSGGITLASSSYFSYLDLNNSGTHESNEPSGKMDVVVLYNNVGRGKVLIFSDSDVLINSMINQGDNLFLVKRLIPNNCRAYVLRDLISTGTYTIFKTSFSLFFAFLFNSSVRYPFIALLLIASYFFGKATYKELTSLLKVKH